MATKQARKTAASSTFLAEVKRVFNAKIYKKCLDLVNSEGGEAAARAYLLTYIVLEIDF
jgi:hypothetical protein